MMSDYLYYCAKCNSLVSYPEDGAEVVCESCHGKMAPLHLDMDAWDAMPVEKQAELLGKFQMQQTVTSQKAVAEQSAGAHQEPAAGPAVEQGPTSYAGRFSKMSIVGFILSFFGCTSIAGVTLGIIDLLKKDGRKRGLAIAAIAIGGVITALEAAIILELFYETWW